MNREEKLRAQAGLVSHLHLAGELALAKKYDTRALKAKRTYARDARRFKNAAKGHRLAASFILSSLAS